MDWWNADRLQLQNNHSNDHRSNLLDQGGNSLEEHMVSVLMGYFSESNRKGGSKRIEKERASNTESKHKVRGESERREAGGLQRY